MTKVLSSANFSPARLMSLLQKITISGLTPEEKIEARRLARRLPKDVNKKCSCGMSVIAELNFCTDDALKVLS